MILAAHVNRDGPWLVVFNASAGGGRSARRFAALLAALTRKSIDFEVLQAPDRASMRQELEAHATRGARRFVVAGGDGTVHAVINELHALTILRDSVVVAAPLGGGNDWCRNQRLPRDPDSLANALLHAPLRLARVGLVEGLDGSPRCCFVNAVGVGLDVEVLAHAPRRLPATLRYLSGLLHAFFGYRGFPLTWKRDGVREEQWIFLAMAAIGAYSGGGMNLAPHAAAAPARLAVTVIARISWGRLLLSGYRLFNGTLGARREVALRHAAVFELLGPEAVPFQADGEIVGSLPVRVKLSESGFLTIDVADP